MAAITIEGISHCYGDTEALNDITLEVGDGELFGLIGPDGAGKTTLFEILTTLRIPTTGRATVLGRDTVRDYRELRRLIGYMPGRFSLYPDLTVRENLDFFATIFGTTVEANRELVDEIYSQLEPFERRRASDLSGGMKQKLALCCALIHQPEVLFLDEPTTGVDAVSRAEFWDMLGRLRDRGIPILVSTPYMDEASRCERIALIQTGRILGVDTPEGIAAGYGKPLYAVSAKEFFRLLGFLRKLDGVTRAETFGEYIHVTTERREPVGELENSLHGAGFTEVEVRMIEPGIEDVFLDRMERPHAANALAA